MYLCFNINTKCFGRSKKCYLSTFWKTKTLKRRTRSICLEDITFQAGKFKRAVVIQIGLKFWYQNIGSGPSELLVLTPSQGGREESVSLFNLDVYFEVVGRKRVRRSHLQTVPVCLIICTVFRESFCIVTGG